MSPAGAGSPTAAAGPVSSAGSAGSVEILCVDDDPLVLDGLRRQLRGHYEVVPATSGDEALRLLAEGRSFPVIVSDMRMPGMNGAALLSRTRELAPDMVRVLLTGHSDVHDTVAAVNEGNIFRFLLKPASQDSLLAALRDAAALHRTLVSERQLLQETLRGSLAALMEVLALASPVAFARAGRIHRTVQELIGRVHPADAWPIEIAAMVSQMGSVVLPPATIEKLDRGEALDPDEVSHLAELPVLAERLLSHIPRLEGVRQILRDQALDHMVAAGGHHRTPEQETVRVGAAMLRLAVDLDSLEAAGASRPDALHELRQRAGVYDPDLISALSELPGGEEGPDVVPIGVASLRAGMTLACNVTDVDGRLLVGRGVRVSDGMIELIGKWRLKTAVSEPVYIAVHPPLSGAA